MVMKECIPLIDELCETLFQQADHILGTRNWNSNVAQKTRGSGNETYSSKKPLQKKQEEHICLSCRLDMIGTPASPTVRLMSANPLNNLQKRCFSLVKIKASLIYSVSSSDLFFLLCRQYTPIIDNMIYI